MEYTHQSLITLHNYQDKQNMQKSSISIGKLCDDECIVTFDKHRIRVRKNKANIIEDYRDPMNGVWRLPLHNSSQGNLKSNMIAHSTRKHWCQHIKTMAPRHPGAYQQTSQQDLSIFNHQILCCPKKSPCYWK